MPSYRTKPMKSPRAIAPSPIGQIDQLPSPSPDTDQHLVTVLSLAQGLGIDFLPLTTLQFLSGPDIARAGRTNRFLYRVSLNEGLWQSARDALWEGKVCVSSEAKALPPRRAKDAYIQSLRDSTRTWLGQDELTTFSWWFRFKQQAGEAWTAQDPWYRNEKAPTVEFKDDHTVLRHGDMSLPPAADMSWRFVPRTGLRTGPSGSFLRVSIGGREVPTYIVSRHPSNWGFLLESCWTLYTSWEMPPKDGPGSDRSLLDDKLKVTMDDQWEEAMSFNTGLSFEIYDLGLGNEGSDEEGDDGDNNSMDGADAEGNGVLIASGDGGGGSIGVDVGVGAEWREPQIVPTLDEFVEHDTIEENDYDGRSGEDDDDERSQFDDISDGDGQHVEYGGC